MRRLPRRRPTYPANTIATAGHVLAPLFAAEPELQDHGSFLDFLRAQDIRAPSLSASRLARRARIVAASAFAFEQVLRTVKPKLAFAVTWYAGLGPAFMLACRRQGILAVDLQHCPQGGRHKAYRWSGVPGQGFNVLPAVFWNWNGNDATHIASWARGPWHRSIVGGHPRLAPLLDDETPEMPREDRLFRDTAGGREFQREVLVALQTTGRPFRAMGSARGCHLRGTRGLALVDPASSCCPARGRPALCKTGRSARAQHLRRRGIIAASHIAAARQRRRLGRVGDGSGSSLVRDSGDFS